MTPQSYRKTTGIQTLRGASSGTEEKGITGPCLASALAVECQGTDPYIAKVSSRDTQSKFSEEVFSLLASFQRARGAHGLLEVKSYQQSSPALDPVC